jgi:dihydroorotate dehydrogenase electron transfer subunit
MIQETGVVRHIHRFRPALFSLTLDLPGIARSTEPGQFVHVKLDRVPEAILRRPFSVAAVRGNEIDLIIKAVGTGTKALAESEVGQRYDVLGPLGRGFTIRDVKTAYLIGGGIGVAPLLALQDELLKRGIAVHFFLGGQTHQEFPLPDDALPGRNIVAATDDGSFGETGFVTAAFENHIRDGIGEKACVYSCGPVLMMKETDRICAEYKLSHQVSLENRMACGIGVCQGCALKLSEDGDRGGFRLVCSDGPVFDARDVDWASL